MEFGEKFGNLRRKVEVFFGLMTILLVNIVLGVNPELAKLSWPLQIQAALVFTDWVWPVILLPKMEWQNWHDKWALFWLMLVVLETGAMWWYFTAELGQTLESGPGVAIGSLVLRIMGVFLMRP